MDEFRELLRRECHVELTSQEAWNRAIELIHVTKLILEFRPAAPEKLDSPYKAIQNDGRKAPMRREPLSEKELQAIRLIRNALVHRGKPPTVRELAADLGYRSPRSASDILDALEARGIVKRANRRLRLTKDPEEQQFNARTIDVPLVGSVAAGAPILAEENIQAMVPVSVALARPPHRYFLLRVQGDSMDRAGVEDGSLVLVKQQSSADDGEMVVALIDDEATVKVLRRSRDAVLLVPQSTNPTHKPIVLTQEFQVQGVVRATLPNPEEGEESRVEEERDRRARRARKVDRPRVR